MSIEGVKEEKFANPISNQNQEHAIYSANNFK